MNAHQNARLKAFYQNAERHWGLRILLMHQKSRTFLLPWRLSNSSYGREGSGGTDKSESDDKGVHHLTVQVVIGLIKVIDSINWFDRLQLLLINTINTINDLVCCVYQSTVTVVTVSGSVRYSSNLYFTFNFLLQNDLSATSNRFWIISTCTQKFWDFTSI